MSQNEMNERKEIMEEDLLDVNGGTFLEVMNEGIDALGRELIDVFNDILDKNEEPEKEIISDSVFNDYYIV